MGKQVIGTSSLVSPGGAPLKAMKNRTIDVYGVAIHQTGSGIVAKAMSLNKDPLEYTLDYYLRPDSFSAHYVIGWDGKIGQVTDENGHAMHIGLLAPDHSTYISKKWETIVSGNFVARWKARWPEYQTPCHLYPGASPNDAYVGMEMSPVVDGCGAVPLAPGLKYTKEQHEAVGKLCFDIAARWGFPDGWEKTGRLATHEDITPIDRSAKGEGWDPGIIRDSAWFDWDYLGNFIQGLK